MDAGYRGSFVWHELMTTDPGGASAFYPKLIKWQAQPWDVDPSYTLFMAGNVPVAGLMKMTEEVRAMGGTSNWLAYIGTPDVDATLASAVQLGAKVMRGAMDLPKVGRIAILLDPQGACFGLYKPATEMPPPPAPIPGDFTWHELVTTDAEAGFKFYAQLFGWVETRRMDMGPMGTYYIFGKGAKELGGMMKSPPERPGPPSWLAYADVNDIKRAAAAITAAGGKLLMGPAPVPDNGWIAQGLDGQGAMFAVYQGPRAAKSAATAKPTASKPAASKPVALKPVASKPAASKPVPAKAVPKPKPKAKVKPKAKAKPKVKAKAKAKATKKTAPKKKVATRKKSRKAPARKR